MFFSSLTPSFKLLEQKTEGERTIVKIEMVQNVPTNDVVQYLMNSGTIESFNPIVPSMNSIFIEAVKQHNETVQNGQDVENI